MQRRQIPQGYVSSFESYTNPVQSVPPPPIIQQKEAQTLMGHSLKQLIKERLYGNIINYNRIRSNKKQHSNNSSISPKQNSNNLIAKSTSSIPDYNNSRVSEFKTNLEKRIDYRYDNIIRKVSQGRKEESHRNSFADIEESLLTRNNRHKKNKSAFSSKNDSDSNEKSIEYEIDKYKGSSFLSAIEEDEGLHNSIKAKKKTLKLSPLSKNNNLGDKLDKVKSMVKSPVLNRFQMDKFQISPLYWENLCKKHKQKYQNELQQALLSQINSKDQSSLMENKSFNLTSVVSSKSNNNLVSSLIPSDKSKFLLSKSVFSKELFYEYLSNPKYVIKGLVQHILSFFQLNGKIYDQMKLQDYKRILEPMMTAGPRVWAVCAFRFWDTDKNGVICSNDIFKIFKELDQLENQLKKDDNQQLSKSTKMLVEMKNTVQRLRELILTQSLDEKLVINPSNLQQLFEIKYLEESILRRKEIRFSDLQLILGHHMKNILKQTKRSVIETTKEISIKMSSCYRYSFLATDHNEQTRQDRDQIQTLKQSLKREKMEMKEKEKENQLINKKLTGIQYSSFFEQKLYLVVKEIAFSSFGIQSV